MSSGKLFICVIDMLGLNRSKVNKKEKEKEKEKDEVVSLDNTHKHSEQAI